MLVFLRRRLRISLRCALWLFLAAGCGLGWLGRHIQEHRVEQRHIAAIRASSPFNGAWPQADRASGEPNLSIFL